MASRSTGWCTRLVWLLTIILVLVTGEISSRAQAPAANAAGISGQVSTPYGQPAASAQVRVCPITATQTICTPLATLYTNSALTVQSANPFSTDANGNYKVFAATGLYLVQVTVSPGVTYTYYTSAGSSSTGSGAIPPVYSIQFANTALGAFGSDGNITINPTSHILTTPELFVPGGGTGLIGITGQTSLDTVYQTVSDSTLGYTFQWPAVIASSATNCLTGSAATPTANVIGVWQPCTLTGNFVPIPGGTMTGPLTTPAITTTTSINAAFVPPTIQSAITAAGNAGSVLVPGSYTGTDSFSANPYSAYINDQRALCSTTASGLCTAPNLNVPIRYIYAADHGAKCKGIAALYNDGPAIQDAFNQALAYTQSSGANTTTAVVLPQGSCVIKAPLKLGWHGGIVGQGSDSTYIVADYATDFAPWIGTDYNAIEISVTGTQLGGTSQGQRPFYGFSVIGEGNSSLPSTTGITVINTSNVYNPSQYGVDGLSFHDLLIGQFDTCVDVEDMINAQFQFNKIQNCRIGLQFNGDVNNNFVTNNTIASGTLAFTSTTGGTIGFNLIHNTKYGGGFEQPQGVFAANNSIEDWGTNVHIDECIACDFHDNQIDLAGTNGFQIDENGVGGYGVYIHHNLIGVNNNAGSGIYLAAITDTTESYQNMGFWITENEFQLDAYPTVLPSSNNGILFVAGFPLYGVHITGNQCVGMATCISLGQSLVDSYIRDNNAAGALNSVVNLSETASLNHINTVIDGNIDNADSISVVNVGTATGFRMGYNVSPVQVFGTFKASGSGCSLSGGVGQVCTATITIAGIPAGQTSTAYSITGCQVVGASGYAVAGTVGSKTSTNFFLTEVNLDASAVTGGTISCNVQF